MEKPTCASWWPQTILHAVAWNRTHIDERPEYEPLWQPDWHRAMILAESLSSHCNDDVKQGQDPVVCVESFAVATWSSREFSRFVAWPFQDCCHAYMSDIKLWKALYLDRENLHNRKVFVVTWCQRKGIIQSKDRYERWSYGHWQRWICRIGG